MADNRADALNELVGGRSDLVALRDLRPAVKQHLQEAFSAIFAPGRDYGLARADRLAIAYYVALLHKSQPAEAFYEKLLVAGGGQPAVAGLRRYADATATAGPYGAYLVTGPLARESVPGIEAGPPGPASIEPRLGLALAHAHLVVFHPRDAGRHHLAALARAGWSDDQIVLITQVAAVLAFQLRVAEGLLALSGQAPETPGADPEPGKPAAGRDSLAPVAAPGPAPEADPRHPQEFTDQVVPWEPWITSEPTGDGRDDFDWEGVFGRRRASSPSFRLSARDPLISLPLSRIEDDVFHAPTGKLPRGDRELGALAVSRLNGCMHCASVHARTTIKFTGDHERTHRILREGVHADLGPRWNALIRFACALTSTPGRLSRREVAGLHAIGLDDEAILDLIHSIGYFNFANRIMLGLGSPVLP